MGRLDGKVAIVTGTTPPAPSPHPLTPPGAGSGFGAGIALRYAAEGCKVLVCDINEKGGQATAAQDTQNLAFHKMDVTKRADWEATMAAVQDKFGRCDILVNNAGWSYVNKPTVDVTDEEFERVFDVNVKGVYLGCQAWVGQAVDRKEGGVIVNIASVGATRPRPGLVWYNASKGAVWNVSFLCEQRRRCQFANRTRRPRAWLLSTALTRSVSTPSARL